MDAVELADCRCHRVEVFGRVAHLDRGDQAHTEVGRAIDGVKIGLGDGDRHGLAHDPAIDGVGGFGGRVLDGGERAAGLRWDEVGHVARLDVREVGLGDHGAGLAPVGHLGLEAVGQGRCAGQREVGGRARDSRRIGMTLPRQSGLRRTMCCAVPQRSGFIRAQTRREQSRTTVGSAGCVRDGGQGTGSASTCLRVGAARPGPWEEWVGRP